MSGYYALNEIYDLQMGKTPSRDNQKYWINGNYDWISIADLTKYGEYTGESKEKITQTAIEESGIRVIPSHTLIMSFKLSIGKVAITSRDCFSNEAIMAFIDKGVEKIIPEYAYYLFLAQDWGKGINRAVMGATLNKATLSKYRVHIHDEGTQREIICNLNKITNAINLRKRQIEEIDNLVKSQFIEMFGGCSLRNRQTDWVKIGTVAEVVGGSTPKTDKKEYWDGEYYWITPAEISEDDFVVYKTQRTLTELGVRSSSLRRLPTGTILLSSRAPIGKVAIAGVEMYCNQGFKNLVCGKELNPIYGYALLKYNTEYLNSLGRGATFKEISKAIVENIYIPVPPIERQNDFARFVEQTDKSKVLLAIKLFFHLYTAICLKAFEKSSQMMYNHR